jgi:hypothetical protein
MLSLILVLSGLCEFHNQWIANLESKKLSASCTDLLLLLLLLLYTAIGFSPGGSSPYTGTQNTNGKLQNSTYSKYKYTH